jgi:hypothetical protein
MSKYADLCVCDVLPVSGHVEWQLFSKEISFGRSHVDGQEAKTEVESKEAAVAAKEAPCHGPGGAIAGLASS